MNRAAIFSLPLLFVLIAAAPATQPQGQTFNDSKGDFSITAQATWKQGKLRGDRQGLLEVGLPSEGTKASPMFQAARAFQANAAEQPLDQGVRTFVEQITKRPAAETKVETTQLDGVEARKFNVTLPVRDVPIDFAYVLVIHKK